MASLKYSTYIDFIKLTLKHSLGFLEGLIQKFLLARVGAFRLGVGSERVGVGKFESASGGGVVLAVVSAWAN